MLFKSISVQIPPCTAGVVLVSGSDLEYLSGELYFGDAIAAGSIRRVGNSVFKRLEAGQSILGEQFLPFDFEEQFVLLRDASMRLAQSPANGESTYQSGGVYLTGDCQSPVQIFTIDGAQLLTADTFEVNCISDDATVIFNISDEATGFDRVSFSTLTNHREKTLYNFHQATSLSLRKVDIEGSILAPYTDIYHPMGDRRIRTKNKSKIKTS